MLSHSAYWLLVETECVYCFGLIITSFPDMHRNQVIYHNVAVLTSSDEVLVCVVEYALDLKLLTHMPFVSISDLSIGLPLVQQGAALPLEQHQRAGGGARHNALIVTRESDGAHRNYA